MSDGHIDQREVALRLHVSPATDAPGGFCEILRNAGLSARPSSRVRGLPIPPEVIVALGSAGVFSALFRTVSSFLQRNTGHEVTMSRGDVSITLKAHTLSEERELLGLLAPELLQPPSKAQ